MPVPDGTQIQAVANNERPGVDGERVWALPDLPPDTARAFQFTVQLLGSKVEEFPLLVEIDGPGLDEPVTSSVTITVAR